MKLTLEQKKCVARAARDFAYATAFSSVYHYAYRQVGGDLVLHLSKKSIPEMGVAA